MGGHFERNTHKWRSFVPEIALQAVLLRPQNEKMDVEAAIEELSMSSFIEVVEDDDNNRFISVPLVASVFGKRKLEVSPMKPAIEADVELLFVFGATQVTGIKQGIEPRIKRLFNHVAREVAEDRKVFSEYHPILEFICSHYPPAWLMFASFYEESDLSGRLEKAKDSILRLLESTSDIRSKRKGWEAYARICQIMQDHQGEIHALVESCKLIDTPIMTLSNVANRLNSMFREDTYSLDSDEKQIMVSSLVEIMEERASEADATYFSRLAWLCLHIHDEEGARKWTKAGIEKDPNNMHCQKLASRLELN